VKGKMAALQRGKIPARHVAMPAAARRYQATEEKQRPGPIP
jgi:hypothetical protein